MININGIPVMTNSSAAFPLREPDRFTFISQ
jgi:hypothetical protein